MRYIICKNILARASEFSIFPWLVRKDNQHILDAVPCNIIRSKDTVLHHETVEPNLYKSVVDYKENSLSNHVYSSPDIQIMGSKFKHDLPVTDLHMTGHFIEFCRSPLLSDTPTDYFEHKYLGDVIFNSIGLVMINASPIMEYYTLKT
jgi:hypothetical protein